MKITEIIEEIGRPVAYYPRLAKVFGIKESILLSQLLYWKGKEYEPKKGIKKTTDEIEKETGLTHKEQRRIKDKLKELNCIDIEYNRLNHSSYYLLNETTINEIYQEHTTKRHLPKGQVAPAQRASGTCPKVRSSIHRLHIDYTKTTKAKQSFANNNNTSLISEIIKLFETINPACKKMYNNISQRSACEFLLKEFGFERIKKIIKTVLPKSNGMDFFPIITTPCKLRDKWSDLEIAIKRHTSKQAEQNKKGKKVIIGL